MKKRNYFSDIEDRNENSFSVIADFEGNEEQLMDVEVDEILPVLPLRNMVLFIYAGICGKKVFPEISA